jgi:hypothetical protein
MKKYFTIQAAFGIVFLGASLFSCAEPASNAQENIGREVVVLCSEDDTKKEITVCPYQSEYLSQDGHSCVVNDGCSPSYFLIWKGDLNGDGFDDYILADFQAFRDGPFGERTLFHFYTSKDSKSFYHVGSAFVSGVEVTDKWKNSHKILRSHTICFDVTFDKNNNVKSSKHSERWAFLLFDENENIYKLELLDGKFDGLPTVCTVNPWPDYMRSRRPVNKSP